MEDTQQEWPRIIQGGMGVAISSWRLARAVSQAGELGVVSGTAIDRVLALRLQEGDPGGHLKRAFDAFPNQAMAERVYERWYQEEGLLAPGKYRSVPMFSLKPGAALLELSILGAFCEVWLAREGHPGQVGINLLEKIQLPTLPVLYGALLAGVDVVLMGAGIPRDIPGHLDKLCRHQPCELKIPVDGGEDTTMPFDPSRFGMEDLALTRPKFLAIVSSQVLAMALAKSGGVDGFVVEAPNAGGHNAPPRGWKPGGSKPFVYGPKDCPDLDKIRALGKPFWLAGGQVHPEALVKAAELGAQGVQVGTAFAFCRESGMEPSLRQRAIQAVVNEGLETRTEASGSPTGFPFKVLPLSGTEGGRPAAERDREPCVHGYLRTAYRRENGSIGWRCTGEPEAVYGKKGGDESSCGGARCLCNGLLATAGHPHLKADGSLEKALVTCGDDLPLEAFLGAGEDYGARQVLDYLRGGSQPA